jgi:hypothetical protein
VLLCAACWSPPEPGRPRTPLQSLQRPLQPDLSTASFAARTRRLAAMFVQMTGEPGRIQKTVPVAERLFAGEVARTGRLPATATWIVHDEADRTAALQGDAGDLLHEVVTPEGDGDRHAAIGARLLGIDRRPLGEIDDRQHRTDPDDNRAEATLWQRLVRRLRL